MKRIIAGAAVVVIIAAFIITYFLFSAPCLILKDGGTGKLLAAYPVDDGKFSITFIHSVNKSPVTDVYEIRSDGIYVVKTIYYSFGAGVQTELGKGQTLKYGTDGSMIISGFDRQMKNLSYIVGTVSDHILEINGETVSLREICGKNTTVRFVLGRRPML